MCAISFGIGAYLWSLGVITLGTVYLLFRYTDMLRHPIEQVRQRLLGGKLATEDDLKALDRQVREVVNASADFAQADAEPDARELWTDVTVPVG